jgi:hypothetical protein
VLKIKVERIPMFRNTAPVNIQAIQLNPEALSFDKILDGLLCNQFQDLRRGIIIKGIKMNQFVGMDMKIPAMGSPKK